MTPHAIFKRVSPRFRRRRIADFMRLFKPTAQTRILDVGGYPQFWVDSGIKSQITVLNVHDVFVPESLRGQCRGIIGDGTALRFGDGEFDVVFSNSVIEHLGTWKRQQQFAKEVSRVGKSYYVQTPAYEFFIEPHYITPCIHWFSKPTQKRVMRNFTVWGWLSRPSREAVESTVEEIRLLRASEFQELFPHAKIVRERFAGLTKSYVAVSI